MKKMQNLMKEEIKMDKREDNKNNEALSTNELDVLVDKVCELGEAIFKDSGFSIIKIRIKEAD